MNWDRVILEMLKLEPQRTWMFADICAGIPALPIVTAHHRKMWGSQPDFEHWVLSALYRLTRAQLVEQVGPDAWRVRAR